MIYTDIRMMSYNCRGWISSSAFVESLLCKLDLLLIQEHWLFTENLASLNINVDFATFAVSGMDSSTIARGRPFGGCGFLIRKSLLSYINRINSNSKRFCAITITINSWTTLVINVYMPTNYGTAHSHNSFVETLGELRGTIESHSFDKIVIAGDFNVDMLRSSDFRDSFMCFMSDFNLCSVDLLYRDSVKFTYERDGGSVRSWPDHVLTLQHHSGIICDIHSVHSPCNFSDHVPLAFLLKLDAGVNGVSSSSTSKGPNVHNAPFLIDWSALSAGDIENYRQTILHKMPSLAPHLLSCRSKCCSLHHAELDSFCNQFLACLSCASSGSFLVKCKRMKTIPGWNDQVRKVRASALLWNMLWVDADCPVAGVLFDLRKQTKKAYKYAVRRVKRRQKTKTHHQ